MKSYSTFKNSEIASIAIGSFDGVHYAHKKLFEKLIKGNSVIVVIEKFSNLTPNRYRENFIDCPILYIDLEDIKDLTPIEFIELLKNKFINLKKIVVGYDFKFGKNRACNSINLRELSKLEVDIVDEVKIDGESVHSRYIRAFISSSNIKKANLFLDRNYEIVGTHIRGNGLGNKELFPTINLDVKEFLIPQSGVYATKTTLNKTSYNSITFIGNRVTIDNKFSIETHILDLDFKDNIFDLVKIEFIDFIRDNIKFDSISKLKRKIEEDLINAKIILEKNSKKL